MTPEMSDFLLNRHRELYANEIRWHLNSLTGTGTATRVPVHDVSTPDAAGLAFADVVDLEAQVASFEADIRMYREMVRVMLDTLQKAQNTIARQSARLLEQAEQLRMVRRG